MFDAAVKNKLQIGAGLRVWPKMGGVCDTPFRLITFDNAADRRCMKKTTSRSITICDINYVQINRNIKIDPTVFTEA